jgi:transcriptional regulator with XRE-family HTH domain
MVKFNKDDFVPARRRIALTTGEVIRILRELMGWTQRELAERSGINEKNISLLEHDKIEIGRKRAEQLARAFNIHPAIIMFPGYGSMEVNKAA